VAAVTGFIAGHGGSVLEAAQHGDLTSGMFFLRIEVTAESLPFGPEAFREAFSSVAEEFAMEWHLTDTGQHKRVVLLVSKEDHCLADLLNRWRSGDLECDIACVISNHDDLRSFVEWHGIPFHLVPVTGDPSEKAAAFDEIARIFEAERADVMVLARYMQIIPPSLCTRYGGRIINIHHSFLPSFAGSRPYHQAFARGVKLIGATCHYVTADLDEGPRRQPRGAPPGRAGRRAHRPGPGLALASRGPRAAQWQQDHRVRLGSSGYDLGSRTLVALLDAQGAERPGVGNGRVGPSQWE
jgi:formyltetrahydrofolate deformylase